MGIIGIIAALTIPSIITKHQEKTTVSKLKKFYTTFQQAQILAINENGPINNWGLDSTNINGEKGTIYYEKIKPFLKITKDCGIRNDCFPKSLFYKYADGSMSGDFGKTTNFPKGILSDGSYFWIGIGSYSVYPELGSMIGSITYDINGYKGPNAFGQDVFTFDIYNDRIVPTGIAEYGKEGDYSFAKGCYTSGTPCTAWVIYNENQDYLHCDDLSWDGKTKCN